MFAKLIAAVLLLSLLKSGVNSFSCGSNRFERTVARIFVSLDCYTRYSQFDRCCATHDSCYDRQLGRNKCDQAFCRCVKRAGRGTLCVYDAKKFCDWVVSYGQKAYDNAA